MSIGKEHTDWDLSAQERPHQVQDEPDTVHEIPIEELKAGYSPRLNGEVSEHIEALAAPTAALPPILVHRGTMRVIDGMHRLRAAQLRGRRTIEVRFFDGTEADAFVLAVKTNTAHGLPLRLADREAAATRIIALHPRRSDHWIAAIAGLAVSTVAAIRRRTGDGTLEVTSRIGRDGRVRPLDSAEGRRRASEAIAEHPEASLREIAKIVGISPGTVRDVRERMRRGEDPVRSRQPNGDNTHGSRQPAPAGQKIKGNSTSARPLKDRASLLRDLQRDPSLRYSEAGRALLRWLNGTAKGPGSYQHLVSAVPTHSVYSVAQVARRCAEEWLEAARELEHRTQQISQTDLSSLRA